ncbi:MAG: hypothetical protein AAF745_08250 [Planctomycetota bacterium]
MSARILLTCLTACMALFITHDHATAIEPSSQILFEADFESDDGGRLAALNDLHDWEFLDAATWRASGDANNGTIEITARKSDYQPPTRSPGHVGLVRNLIIGDCEIRFRVRSTKDTGNHRDCCVFFGYQDSSHFYYCHLGAKPDPHSGQIMIVDDAPRLALTTNDKPTPWDDDWHEVLLRRDTRSGLIEVYFDDMATPHMSVVDHTFGEGRVGIGSFDDLNEFDDFTITRLP